MENMVAGARQAALTISQTANLLQLSHTTMCRIYREWPQKRKHPMSSSCMKELGTTIALQSSISENNTVRRTNTLTGHFVRYTVLAFKAFFSSTDELWHCGDFSCITSTKRAWTQWHRGSGGFSKIIEMLDLQGGISLLWIAEYKWGETVRVGVMSAVEGILSSKLSSQFPPPSFSH